MKSPKKKIGICDLPMPPMSDEMDEDADYSAKASAMGKQDNYKSCALTSLKNTYVYEGLHLLPAGLLIFYRFTGYIIK